MFGRSRRASQPPLLDRLLALRLLFVGGKGGVGKTSTAAALALLAAERGRRCLLVSTDPAHSLGDIFEESIGGRETMLAGNLTALEIDPDDEADRYLGSVRHSLRSLVAPSLYDEIERQMELARSAPGAVEAALLERVTELSTEGPERFDLVLFDTAPTGHTLRLLAMPEVMAAYTDSLLHRRERSDRFGQLLDRIDGRQRSGNDRASRIREILLARRRRLNAASRLLLDPAVTGFLLVLNPEKLPILESRRTVDALDRFHVPVQALIVNRVLPADADGSFLETRRSQEAAYLREIEETFSDLPRLRLPLLPHDVRSRPALATLARLFEREAG